MKKYIVESTRRVGGKDNRTQLAIASTPMHARLEERRGVMSYRKLFLLITFAPLALLLFVRDAQPWDGDDSPWGFIDWEDGSRVRCTIGFGDTTITDEPGANGTLTLRISLKPGKTLTCAKIDDKLTQSGQATLVNDLLITGVQDLGCSNLPGGVSQRTFQATCGERSADVTGKIQWVDGPLGPPNKNTYEFGGAAFLKSPGACNQFFPKAGTFDRNVIFINTKGFNSQSCSGDAHHGPALFRGCSATNLNTPSECIDAVHTGGTSAKEGLRQLTQFGLTCRVPFNSSSCANNPSGVIQAEIDCSTLDPVKGCEQIDRSSLQCGEPDNPFKVAALRVREVSGDLEVTCPRCFKSAFVPSSAGELVVAGQKSDGTKFTQDIGGLCSGTPTSR
jgi:hypothetical protein